MTGPLVWRRRLNHGSKYAIEWLEPRGLLSGFSTDLHTLSGRFYRQGSVFGSDTDTYKFHIADQGFIDVQLSRLIGTGFMVLKTAGGGTVATTSPSTSDRRITFQALSAGDFVLSVRADQAQFAPSVFYTLAVTTDLAQGAATGSSGPDAFRTDKRRDLGIVTETAVNEAKDFVGYLDTSDHQAQDLIDTYRFVVPVVGTFDLKVSGVASDPAGGVVSVDMGLYRDSDNDGSLESSERLRSFTVTPSSGPGDTNGTIPTGTYFVVLSRRQPPGASTFGGTNYTMDLTYRHFDAPGETLDTARSATLSASPTSFDDLLSPDDATDFYKFVVGPGGPFNFDAKLTGVASSDFDIQLIEDKNHDGQVEALNGEILSSSQTRGVHDEHIATTLTVGDTYFLKVQRFFGEDAYRLTMSLTNPDLAGNSIAAAKQVGEIFGQLTFSDLVNANDPSDFYRFTTTLPGVIALSVPGPSSGNDVNLQLLNSNGVVIGASVNAGTAAEALATSQPPGTYFAKVFRGAGSPPYTLTINVDTAGNTLAAARNLGTLDGRIVVRDFVGAEDDKDFYKLHVTAPGELRIDTLFPTNGQIAADVISDVLGNGSVEAGDILATLSTGVSLDGVVLPAAGDYFVRFRPNPSGGNYRARLAFSPQTPFGATPIHITSANPGVRIEAENFDNGGEGVAYHDSTAGNDTGAARAGDNVDVKAISNGQLVVGDTVAGEFLEYTAIVDQAGSYDLEVRVGSPSDGAAFHMEVDGVNVSGRLAIPNTGSFDTLTSVTKPGIALAGGPHVFRLVMETGAPAGPVPGFCGNYNFIRFTRSSASSGTFALSPAKTVVPHGEDHLALSLQWTVPGRRSWHTLSEILLRLRDVDGTAIWLRFNESTGTLRLFDPDTDTFGPPGTPGSIGVLENRVVRVNLSACTVKAAGPASPTVQITFDLTLRHALRGRHFIVEAGASDDLGRVQHFAFAGMVDVKA
jgi:hypothetical protein